MKIVAGNSNRPLAEAICQALNLKLTKSVVKRFADMEVFVEVQENVRGEDVYVIQSTSFPANDNLMELLILVDALKTLLRQAHHGRHALLRLCASGSALRPPYAHLRQARRQLIERAGVDRVMTLDLHAGQIQGFFDIPTDNLFAAPVMVRDIQERYGADKPHCRVARRWRRGACARARQAHQRADRHLRQASRARR